MSATEFIKEFGSEESVRIYNNLREVVNQTPYKHSLEDFSIELKPYIEAYELVQPYKHMNNGRWHFIADYCSKSQLLSPFDSEVYNMVGAKYDNAIKLVEEIEC